jgi:hypothetical protein
VEQENPNVKQPERAAGAAQPPRIVKDTVGRHYANCAMIMTSPADLSVYFGRYQPMSGPGGEHALAEVYDVEVTMNFEQAWKLCSALVQTLRALSAGRASVSAQTGAAGQGNAPAAEGAASSVSMDSFSELEIELPPEFSPDGGRESEGRISGPGVERVSSGAFSGAAS